MKAFETFRDYDAETGVVNWRAYFTEECFCDQTGDWVPLPNANVGRGDTELEAIGNLCLDEIARIEQELETRERDAARLAPMTELEWLCLEYLHTHCYCWGITVVFNGSKKNMACESLVYKGYAGRNNGYYISDEGKEYYQENRKRLTEFFREDGA